MDCLYFGKKTDIYTRVGYSTNNNFLNLKTMGRKKKIAPNPSQDLYEIPFDYWGFKRWCVNLQDLSEGTADVYISQIRTAFKTIFADDDALFKNLRNAFYSHTREPELRIARLEDNFETLVAYTETIDECGDDFELDEFNSNLPMGMSKTAPKEDWVRAFQCYCRYIRSRIDAERKSYGMKIEINDDPFHRLEIPLSGWFRQYMKNKGKGYPSATINTYYCKLRRLYNLLIRRVDKRQFFKSLPLVIEKAAAREMSQLEKSMTEKLEIEKSRKKRCEIAKRILDIFQKRIDDEMEWETFPDLSYDDVERGRNAFKVYREFLEDFIKYPEKYPRQLYEIPRKKDNKE